MEKIDNLDKKILKSLREMHVFHLKDVAAECGVSRAAIHQRVQRLIDLGVIVGSGYHVDPKTLGYSLPVPTWVSFSNAVRCTNA